MWNVDVINKIEIHNKTFFSEKQSVQIFGTLFYEIQFINNFKMFKDFKLLIHIY